VTGYAPHTAHMQIFSATPLSYGGQLYLIVNGDGIGDVYQIRTDDTVNVTFQGTTGPANGNAPARQTGDIFYGDTVNMSATLSSGTTGGALTWNFGAAHDPANTQNGTFGTPITHQYTGLSKTDVTLPLNVTVTNTATSVTGTTPITLKTGTARVKYGSSAGTKYLVGSGVPIVSDDSFYDASDGDTGGHYSEWRIGADAATIAAPAFTPQLASPTVAVSVGGCGQHALSMTAHYGYAAYSASNVDFPVSFGSTFTYTAPAFVPAVDVSYNSGTGNEEFVSTSRAAAALAGRTFSYTWDVVDANGTAVSTIAPQSGTATSVDTIAHYPVSKALFTQPGDKGRLTLSVSGVDPCSQTGGNLPSQQATSKALVPPDAQLTAVCDTPQTGVCQYSITSPSGVMQSDAWTFAWTASGGSPSTGSTSSLTVSYYTAGSFSLSAVVTNKAGLSKTLLYTANIKTAASQCPTFVGSSADLTPTTTLASITYQGTSGTSACVDSPAATCVPNENIQFSALFYPRVPDQSCLSTLTYAWQIDGTGAGTGSTLTTTFPAGTHTIGLTLGAGNQSVPTTRSITIAVAQQPQPQQPPPPPCATLSALNTVLNVAGQTPACQAGGTCTSTESVGFSVTYFSYNSSCATHTYAWNFDGAAGGTFTNPTTSHVFSTPGQHTYSVTVSNGTSSVALSGSLTVAGGGCATLLPNQNVFLGYSGSTSGCQDGKATKCAPGEQVTASITYWAGYSASCGTHTYSWTLDNAPLSATGQTATFTMPAGDHKVAVAINNGNPSVTLSQTVNGKPATPTYSFDFSITELPLPPFSYAFSVTVTPDANKPTQWQWDFGDGTQVITAGAVQTHTFPDDKQYTISVTAVDGIGGVVSHTLPAAPVRRRGVRH
ncbi:MAG TPA: PKD domain-containing protein, partial [Vicinamibacterales bacterium]